MLNILLVLLANVRDTTELDKSYYLATVTQGEQNDPSTRTARDWL